MFEYLKIEIILKISKIYYNFMFKKSNEIKEKNKCYYSEIGFIQEKNKKNIFYFISQNEICCS